MMPVLTMGRNQTKVGLKFASFRCVNLVLTTRRNQTKVGLKLFPFNVSLDVSHVEEIRPRWD